MLYVSVDVEEISKLFSTYEEVDMRMILHAIYITELNFESIVLSSTDTDLCIVFDFCT